MKRDSFVFRTSWMTAMDALDDSQVAKLIRCISNYVITGEVQALDQVTSMAFSFIRIDLDKDALRYDTTCNRRKENAHSRWMQTDANASKPAQETREMQMHANDANVSKCTKSMQKMQMHANDAKDGDNDSECDNDFKKENPKKKKQEQEQVKGTSAQEPEKAKEENCAKEEKPEKEPDMWDIQMARWIDYRKKIGKSYKSQESVEMALKRLRTLSHDNIEQARLIIDQSIANGWQGIFANRDETPDKIPRSGQANKFYNDSVQNYDSRL